MPKPVDMQECKMNQRIQELIKQAGTDTSGKWMGVEHAEKLVELVVEECNQYALRNWEHGHLLGQDLKIYFGFAEDE
jgi:hypothetical protein